MGDPYPQGFPFGIRDVAELLRLRVRRRQPDSMYTDCPFCGDRRGKMNINFTKNVWRCNYCGEGGGMLALYARLNNTTSSDAYREIYDALLAGDTTWGDGEPEAHAGSGGALAGTQPQKAGTSPENAAECRKEADSCPADAGRHKKEPEPYPAKADGGWNGTESCMANESGRRRVKEPCPANTGGREKMEPMPPYVDVRKEPEIQLPYTALQNEVEIPQAERASDQQVHQAYSLLLGMLSLTPAHRAHLKSEKRGLTDSQIDAFGFRSTPPAFLCRSLAERLLRQGCTLEGVPGFYLHEKGYWTARFSSRASGILIPAIGMDGLIKGMQILLDTPFRDKDDPPGKAGTKYIWLSSASKNRGITSGSPVHFAGDPFSRTVYVTEGLLKADIAHCLTGRTFVAVAGANNGNPREPLFALLAQNGTELVVEAYDMDKCSNAMTAKGSSQICRMAVRYGMECRRLTWNPNYKGIDDWQLALRREKRKAQENRQDSEALNFKEKYLLGQCGMDAMKQEMENLRREVCACNLDRTDKDGESRAAESLDKPPVSGIDGSRMMEKLGLTAEEYAVFCRDGVRALERMLDAQKRDCRFRIYQLAFEAGETVPFAFKGILDLYKAGYEQPPAAKYRLAADSTLTCPAEWTDTEILKRLSACFGSRVPEKEKGCMEHPLASSDVVELKDEAGRRYFYVDGSDFEPVRFSPFLAKPMEKPVQSQRAADV